MRPAAGMLVVKFADYDDVNAAMTLKNRVVSIARADVTLPDGQYFQQDLIGIAVETDAGEPLGTLREILDLPRGSVYVVQGAREVLIPDRPEFVCSIDPGCAVDIKRPEAEQERRVIRPRLDAHLAAHTVRVDDLSCLQIRFLHIRCPLFGCRCKKRTARVQRVSCVNP